MKDLLLKSTKTLAIAAALLGVVTLNSCKDDEGGVTPSVEIVEDGMYVKGAATGYASFDIKALMKTTKNEVIQTERSTLMESYIALSNEVAGFNIVLVAGDQRTTIGPGEGFSSVQGGTNDEPNVMIQKGSMAETDAVFTVPTEGLYHVVYDTKTGTGAITPVEWGIIGQATPTGWSGSTKLNASAFDRNSITYSISGVEMSKGEWKFRYSDGWKVQIDTTEDLGDGKKGVKVNTNFGGSIDDLDAGGSNFNTDQSGTYDVSITWTAGEDYTATITRTGDLPPRDYSAVSVGLIGDAIEGNTWAANDFNSTPSKNEDVYTWTYSDIALKASGGFKVRTAGTWDDINVGYNADILAGPAKDDIQESGGNMQVKADGTYDIVFEINSKEETMSVSFTKK